MSNYHREWLPGYGPDDEGRPTVCIGAEDVDGLGLVSIDIRDPFDRSDVFIVIPYAEAEALGNMLIRKAHEAGSAI